jgi:hypothetical protein
VHYFVRQLCKLKGKEEEHKNRRRGNIRKMKKGVHLYFGGKEEFLGLLHVPTPTTPRYSFFIFQSHSKAPCIT